MIDQVYWSTSSQEGIQCPDPPLARASYSAPSFSPVETNSKIKCLFRKNKKFLRMKNVIFFYSFLGRKRRSGRLSWNLFLTSWTSFWQRRHFDFFFAKEKNGWNQISEKLFLLQRFSMNTFESFQKRSLTCSSETIRAFFGIGWNMENSS